MGVSGGELKTGKEAVNTDQVWIRFKTNDTHQRYAVLPSMHLQHRAVQSCFCQHHHQMKLQHQQTTFARERRHGPDTLCNLFPSLWHTALLSRSVKISGTCIEPNAVLKHR